MSWSDGLADIVFSVRPGALDGGPVAASVQEFTAFFSELIAQRRRHPGDDLVSAMIAGGADALTAMELVGACTLLLFAGHETTTNMLVSSVDLLDRFDAQRLRLLADDRVVSTAADELLRAGGPAKTMVRRVGPVGSGSTATTWSPIGRLPVVV